MKKLMYVFTSAMAVVMLIGFSMSVAQAGPCELADFSPAEFDEPADNPYLSMSNSIGHTYVYEAETEDGLIRDYIQFTSDTTEIMDVNCTVVYDVEYLFVEELGKWVILEETYDWHAWDCHGNFWYFGEDTLEYIWEDDWSDCEPSEEGSWVADGEEAWPGIILLAEPKPGDCVQQEYYEDEAEDRGRVLRLNATLSIGDEDYEDCLVTKEWTPLEPGNIEHKYYAKDDSEDGLGLVYIEELKEKTVIFELVDYYSGPPILSTPIYPCPCCSD